MNYIVGYYSDKGIKKQMNQDSLLIKTAKSPYGRIGLFIVCDGMGGLSQGELASSTVVRELSEWFNNEVSKINFADICDDTIYEHISKVVIDSNHKILEYGNSVDAKLGTTLTLMLTVDTKYYICQVGDSRAYRLGDNIEQLTNDQTLVAREIERGNLTEEQAKSDRRKSVLLQCIGARPEINPVFHSGEIKKDEMYIICSDGFYRKFEKSELFYELDPRSYLNENDLNNKARDLVYKIMERKEIDNISVILIKTIE